MRKRQQLKRQNQRQREDRYAPRGDNRRMLPDIAGLGERAQEMEISPRWMASKAASPQELTASLR